MARARPSASDIVSHPRFLPFVKVVVGALFVSIVALAYAVAAGEDVFVAVTLLAVAALALAGSYIGIVQVVGGGGS